MPRVPSGDGYKTLMQREAEAKAEREGHFAELRRQRNEAVEKQHQEMIAEFIKEFGSMPTFHSHFDPNACYCACPDGECEHTWNGKSIDMGFGNISVTCSRCGISAYSHDIRVF